MMRSTATQHAEFLHDDKFAIGFDLVVLKTPAIKTITRLYSGSCSGSGRAFELPDRVQAPGRV
jgi:hypothetical protein